MLKSRVIKLCFNCLQVGQWRREMRTFVHVEALIQMSNPYFRFKQFTIRHDRCAMRVGTDGVLLGAWVSPPSGGVTGEDTPWRVLDVGTGTGLIALMLAQRFPSACVTAVEIDPEAAGQASENVARSPFADRVKMVCQDFLTWSSLEGYDLIVSNPPFFTETLRSPDALRGLARHVGGLDFEGLLTHSVALMRPQARLAVILPATAQGLWTDLASREGLQVCRRTEVYTRSQKPCRRVLLEMQRADRGPTINASPCPEDRLFISDSAGRFSPEYVALTRDFYLNF